MAKLTELSSMAKGKVLFKLIPEIVPRIAGILRDIIIAYAYDRSDFIEYWSRYEIMTGKEFNVLTDELLSNLGDNEDKLKDKLFLLETLFGYKYWLVTFLYLDIAAEDKYFSDPLFHLIKYLFGDSDKSEDYFKNNEK